MQTDRYSIPSLGGDVWCVLVTEQQSHVWVGTVIVRVVASSGENATSIEISTPYFVDKTEDELIERLNRFIRRKWNLNEDPVWIKS